MSSSIFIFTVSLIPATVLLVFAMKYVSAAVQARARLANDAAYRRLAEATATAQVETRTSLTAVQSEVARLGAGLARIEAILKQVE